MQLGQLKYFSIRDSYIVYPNCTDSYVLGKVMGEMEIVCK
uniref:Uncharacterized protein n=1 Tax=Rhizophora mucronata TaxID=61149 RepID=A0A2P2QH12_RHIMU